MAERWTAAAITPQHGKRYIVTGANSGLGLETTIALAASGAQVIMACRTPSRAEPALAEVRRRVPQAQVAFMPLDLADLASVRAFAEAYLREHNRLDGLINNAGVMALPFQKTRDGFEMQIGTNHFGHFALTGLLFECLRATPQSRIVTVASLAHRWTRGLDLDDPHFTRRPYNKWDAYSKSKLANLVFTFELDRRLRAAGIDIVAVAAHPGYSATNLMFVGPAQERSALGRLVMRIGNALFSQSAAMGALPILYAATAADVRSGDYIGPDGWRELRGYPRKVGCRRSARDPKLGARLWALSEQATGVRYLSA
ncbi:NAD(P)-dependent dehydrogenase, short-chain alcohol dehydrogenase family [Fontimonas thermophila]|uniref:NAD(P)-dependent dehydrogenase, short-chain alcohol dehydrogenase family n=1 Tax=Fontimonas thermophila TaxID=1076937 RepID=A0A1I2I6S4_9GAMM|nr:oxidoreductase [Fontimonas thermophila]SFF37343.1 NAD(P)-dependent dehydrogenase, short-chain alcohol dehydrogenase family [Fontimonas thermophila]